MVAVVLTKVHGPAKSQSPWTLWVLGLSDFTYPWIFTQTTSPMFRSTTVPFFFDLLVKLSKFTEWQLFLAQNNKFLVQDQFEWKQLSFCEFAIVLPQYL